MKGAAGFMAGLRRVGARHKELVEKFLRAVTRGDRFAAARALSPTATITLGDGDSLELDELVAQLNGASVTKTIGAGHTVVVSLHADHGRGIVFADVAWRGNAINRIGYFPA